MHSLEKEVFFISYNIYSSVFFSFPCMYEYTVYSYSYSWFRGVVVLSYFLKVDRACLLVFNV